MIESRESNPGKVLSGVFSRTPNGLFGCKGMLVRCFNISLE